jgi:DNA-binding NarL/FixJ family response regulator
MLYLEGLSCLLKDNSCSIPISTSNLPLLHAALQLTANYPDICLINLCMLADGDTTVINSIRQQAVSTKIIGYYIEEADLQFASALHLDGVFSLREPSENIMNIINAKTADHMSI